MNGKQLEINVERIWLEGEEALIPLRPISKALVRYEVPGLGNKLEIQDYRTVGKAALEAARTEEGAVNFHNNFDSPALVKIYRDDQKTILELRSSLDDDVETYDVLWVAAQAEETLPVWPMAWHFTVPLQEGQQSFVAILE